MEKKINPWLLHIANVKIDNPCVSYKDLLKLAKETYVKK